MVKLFILLIFGAERKDWDTSTERIATYDLIRSVADVVIMAISQPIHNIGLVSNILDVYDLDVGAADSKYWDTPIERIATITIWSDPICGRWRYYGYLTTHPQHWTGLKHLGYVWPGCRSHSMVVWSLNLNHGAFLLFVAQVWLTSHVWPRILTMSQQCDDNGTHSSFIT